jgi:hypothetical protein
MFRIAQHPLILVIASYECLVFLYKKKATPKKKLNKRLLTAKNKTKVLFNL